MSDIISLPPEQIEAAIARIEAEKERRLVEKVEAGEIVSVPLVIVAGTESEALARVEEAKANKLAELRADGDLREVKFTVELIVTGVCKHGEATVSEPWKPMSPPYLPRSSSPAPEANEKEAVREEPQPPIIETYISVQTRACHDDDDAGEIAEGWYSIANGQMTLTDASGKLITSRAMIPNEDPKAVARELLREKHTPEDFQRRIDYPKLGLA